MFQLENGTLYILLFYRESVLHTCYTHSFSHNFILLFSFYPVEMIGVNLWLTLFLNIF